jgi:hypothetical protein
MGDINFNSALVCCHLNIALAQIKDGLRIYATVIILNHEPRI